MKDLSRQKIAALKHEANELKALLEKGEEMKLKYESGEISKDNYDEWVKQNQASFYDDSEVERNDTSNEIH
jgi:hypothetical protein